MPNDRMNENMDRDQMDRGQMDRQNESRSVGGRNPYQGGVPAMQGMNVPMDYRNDYREISRGYRADRMHKSEKNVFRNGKHYKKYNTPDEVFETIISHLTKGVMFQTLHRGWCTFYSVFRF